MKEMLINFWKDEEGATAVEYGLIVALIAAGLVLTFGNLKDAVVRAFNAVIDEMPAA